MAKPRLIPFVLALLCFVVAGGDAVVAVQPPTAGEAPAEGVDASRVMLPCIPVGTYWTGPPQAEAMPTGPNLAVVSIDVRPKDARVHLDGRFVGRARYLDGKPGYLYLEPGSYDLELRLEGYRTVLVELDAKSACRYDLKHRLERVKGPSSGTTEDSYGKGRPFDRVYAPLGNDGSSEGSSRASGPDPSLRKDLDRRPQDAAEDRVTPNASIRLVVSPPSASVLIDDVFVATARELGLMERPLATTAGTHRVVVSAPGYVEVSREVQLAEGETVELEIVLSEKTTE